MGVMKKTKRILLIIVAVLLWCLTWVNATSVGDQNETLHGIGDSGMLVVVEESHFKASGQEL